MSLALTPYVKPRISKTAKIAKPSELEYGFYNGSSKTFQPVKDGFTDRKSDSFIKLDSGINKEEGQAYYYSHLDGKLFSNFLISANKLEIISLDKTVEFLELNKYFNDYDTSKKAFEEHSKKAAGFTYSGAAFLRIVTPKVTLDINGSWQTGAGISKHPFEGRFRLSFLEDATEAGLNFEFIPLVPISESQFEEPRDSHNTGEFIWDVSARPRIEKISIVNFKLSDNSTKVIIKPTNDIIKDSHTLSYRKGIFAFKYQDEEEPSQIAGHIRPGATVGTGLLDARTTKPITQYLVIFFASSGKPCKTNTTTCKLAASD